jgi:N-acetylglucosaminyl-diphospho-decaprenol L-rhamnosyltransferase
MTDVSVVVVSYNTRELLAECLWSIEAGAADLAYETLVVDNASSDGSAEMVLGAFPWVTLIANQRNVGFATANNQAIARATGRYVLLLNSDAMLESRSVREMVDFMDAHSRVGVVGGKLLNPDGSFQGSYADFPTFWSEVFLLTKLSRFIYPATFPSYPESRSEQAHEADWVSGAFLMARMAAIDEVGPLDAEYFMYTEETDWCYRMKRAGWSVWYLPSARVVHWSGQSARKTPEQRRTQLYRSKWLFMVKHGRPSTAAAFGLALRFFSALKLGFWAIRSFDPNQSARDHARQQVHSYAVLLRSF